MVSKICYVVMGLLVITAFLVGCADVPSSGPTPPDPKSQMRFVNADPALANVTVTVDNASAGTIAFQAATPYGEYNAGSRKVALNPGTAADTARIAFTTDRRSTVFILPQASGVREYFKVNERFVYDPVGVASKAVVRLLNLVAIPDTSIAADDVGVTVALVGQTAGTDTVEVEGLLLKGSSGYRQLVPGNYQITVTATIADNDSVLASGTISAAANKRYTSVMMGTATSRNLVNLVDD
jgi:hypothetical protein